MLYDVGDKVIIKDRLYGHEFDIGEEVVVVDVRYGIGDYIAESEVNGEWAIREEELE